MSNLNLGQFEVAIPLVLKRMSSYFTVGILVVIAGVLFFSSVDWLIWGGVILLALGFVSFYRYRKTIVSDMEKLIDEIRRQDNLIEMQFKEVNRLKIELAKNEKDRPPNLLTEHE